VLRDTMCVTVAAIAAGLMAVGAVFVLGAGADLRAWYGLTPKHPAAIPAWELWMHNVGVLAMLLVLVVGVAYLPSRAWDVLMCLLIGSNVLLVAVALASYGSPLLRLVAAHAALELVAFAVMSAAYLDARRERRVRVRVVLGCVLVACVLLAGAALLEGTV
jgi:hypothetical protein